MKKAKIVILSILGLALVSVLSIAGTIAYLQHEDSDINVMTMGNVKIEQLEYERIVDANGNWIQSETADKYGYYPDKLQKFTQSKPLYPAVFSDGVIKYDDRNGSQATSGEGSHQQSWAEVGTSGSNQLFDDSVKNVQDKFVFVKNTGKSDAYVRTLVALEQGSIEADRFQNVIMTNANAATSENNYKAHWSKITGATNVEINGNKYVVLVFTYLGASSKQGTSEEGVLKPGTISYPSLLQIYMKPEATNDDVEDIDGNGNGKYDILVLSQAVQTKGFENSTSALNTAFGEVNEENLVKWFGGKESAKVVETASELQEALTNGGKVILGENIEITSDVEGAALTIPSGKEVTLDLNGHTISGTFSVSKATSLINNDGTLTISNGKLTYKGVGDPNTGYATNTINNSGKLTINGATIINNTTAGSSNVIDNIPGATLVVNSGKLTADKIAIRVRDAVNVTINGGRITGARAVQIQLFQNVNDNTKVTINGGTLTGTSGLAFYSVANGSCTFAKTTIKITDGTFNGGVAFGGGNKSAQETVNITGGKFSDYLGRYTNDGWEDIAKP